MPPPPLLNLQVFGGNSILGRVPTRRLAVTESLGSQMVPDPPLTVQ
jgi:hypothetical protein